MLRAILARLRGDGLTPLESEIAAKQLPIPGATVPARRGVRTVLRHKPARVAATVAAAGVIFFGGLQVGEDREHRQLMESLSVEHERLMAESAGLSDAYTVALEDELRERGLEGKQVEFMGVPNIRTPPPEQADTLAIRAKLEQNEERRMVLWNQLTDME